MFISCVLCVLSLVVRLLFVCLAFGVVCSLGVVRCLWCVACRVMFVCLFVYCLFRFDYSGWFVVCGLMVVVCCVMFGVC